ncbi:MAG TPA: DinB family protein [Nocardioides sp.]|uniref:DinB family protein n=1 Tax=Nocardioides sp. TaxID=35761 RepID=UPI002F420269
MTSPHTAFPEPASTSDLRGLLLDYLDFFRGVVAGKLDGLSADDLVGSTVPSGWTPAGLVHHLVNVERRWLVWGFLAERVPDPWRDASEDGGWITLDVPVGELRSMLDETAARTREIVEAHQLSDVARVGGRFADQASAPQLQWILLHLLQEYARHAGHLDIARELLDGATGEEG